MACTVRKFFFSVSWIVDQHWLEKGPFAHGSTKVAKPSSVTNSLALLVDFTCPRVPCGDDNASTFLNAA